MMAKSYEVSFGDDETVMRSRVATVTRHREQATSHPRVQFWPPGRRAKWVPGEGSLLKKSIVLVVTLRPG